MPVPTSGTSSLDEEVFSSALQSNGNDCAPGEPENCICVLELSGVNEAERKACMDQGAVLNILLSCTYNS